MAFPKRPAFANDHDGDEARPSAPAFAKSGKKSKPFGKKQGVAPAQKKLMAPRAFGR